MKLWMPEEGKACLPREILTIALSSQRGLLIEFLSAQDKPYPSLIRSKENAPDIVEFVHNCYYIDEFKKNGKNKPKNLCKHGVTAALTASSYINREVNSLFVVPRWLSKDERVAIKDLTPRFYGRPGEFRSIKLKEGQNPQ